MQLLGKTEVVIIGCGATGNSAATALAIEGVGTLHLVDSDSIQSHNVTRQVMFTEQDVGKQKANVLARELKRRSPDVSIKAHNEWIGQKQIPIELFTKLYLGKNAVLVCCVDNNPARAYVNRFAVERRHALVSGGTQGMQGWFSAYVPGKTACLDCVKDVYGLAEQIPQRMPCTEQVRPAVAETSIVVGTYMASLARKIVAPIDVDDTVPSGITYINLHQNAVQHMAIKKKSKCKC